MRSMLRAVAALLLTAPVVASAQSTDELVIRVGGYEVAANGAETYHVGRSVGSGRIGVPTTGLFSLRDCGYFTVTVPQESFENNATVGWRVEVVPLKVVEHAVTFRLRWTRAIDTSGSFEPPHEDVEVTLNPGESRPIDSVAIDQKHAKTFDGRPCGTKAASLRVSVDYPDMDRRVVNADVWLVERLPGGQERIQSQQQSIRGVFHRPLSFYFDRLTDGDKRLDIFGTLVADPTPDGFEIRMEAAQAVPNLDQDRGYQAARWFRSSLHIKPNEVVDVALPAQDDKGAPFAGRNFFIRIKPRQIR